MGPPGCQYGQIVAEKASAKNRTVLFVCAANQCRSPMAMALFSDLVARRGLRPEKWRIKSAGIWAINGYSATDFAIQTMKEMKLDLDGHHSQPVTESLLEENKLILCMEKEQVTFLKFNFSNHDGKVFLLSEMAGEENDILDPVGYSLQAYKTTANKILNYLEKGLQNILKVTEK